MILTKGGVLFERIAPAGFRILGALERVAREYRLDLVITSGTDGAHSGPNDPHKRGVAYDVRTHNLPPEQVLHVLQRVMVELCDSDETLQQVSGGLASAKFFGQFEHPGKPSAHLHFQLRHGRDYP